MTSFRLNAGKPATVRGSGLPRVQRSKPPVEWAPNRMQLVPLKCGCEGIPWPLITILGGGESVLCSVHGWTEIEPPPKIKKYKGHVADGQELLPPF